MIWWLLGLIVITYLIYRFLIARIRWRVVRLMLLIPLLFIGFGIVVLGTAWQDARNQLTPEDIDAQIIDRAIVEQRDLVVSISAIGAIQPERQVPLVFAASAPVAEILVEVGQTVAEGESLARLDNADLMQLIDDAEIALELQQTAFDAITSPAREVDIAAAEGAVTAANVAMSAAYSGGITPEQVEIARLQAEIARNRLYQTQLQRDAVGDPQTTPLIQPPTGDYVEPIVDGDPLPPDVIDDINQSIDEINATAGDALQAVNDAIAAQNRQAQFGIQTQRNQLNSLVEQLDFGVQIADSNVDALQGRGADYASLAAANAQRIQAEIALNNLLEGPSDLRVQIAQMELSLAENALAQAREQAEQATLIAPFDGVIAQMNLIQGQVPPQGPAIVLMDTDVYRVTLLIDEADIVSVNVGQQVTFTVDALPDTTITGTVKTVAYTPQRTGQLVTYPVIVELDSTTVPIRVGMSVTAQIIIQERDNVLVVPNAFIRFDRVTRDAFVTVRDENGNFRDVMVLLGERDAEVTEIRSGLSAGQVVVQLPADSADLESLFD